MEVTIKQTKHLKGKIKISGSKNSALPLLAICLLTNKKIKLINVPMITDIYNMISILQDLGVSVKLNKKKNTVILKRKKIKNILSSQIAQKIRASYYLYPGLIHLHNNIKVIKPGGCNFTHRPIDYHIDLFKKTGINVNEQDNFICFEKNKLISNNISFNSSSVGATINALLHMVLIEGTSKIIDQPIEPEVEEVINCLNKMGANIKVENNNIIIQGVKKLKGVTFKVMPDRIELGSYIFLASALKSEVTFTNIKKETIAYLEPYLKQLNINYIYNKEEVYIKMQNKIKGTNIIVSSYPLFPTDLQPIVCSALLTSKEKSTIIDKVYPNRLSHIKEMQKLNANIQCINNVIYIKESFLKGTTLYAHDLRCGFALIICACLGAGETKIKNFEVINRGYENVIEKLKMLGVKIKEY